MRFGKGIGAVLIRRVQCGAGRRPTRAAYNGVASRLGTAKGVEQYQLVAEFEVTCLDHDPIAVEAGRE